MKTAEERMQADGITITPALRYHLDQIKKEFHAQGVQDGLTEAAEMHCVCHVPACQCGVCAFTKRILTVRDNK